ncbi:MAG: ribonuclease III [Clostridia bacterium]|nr:ribonuclease III [Clostridia bacterium]
MADNKHTHTSRPFQEARAPEGLEEAIGYTFRNKQILTEALTHSSYSNEKRSKGVKLPCNERLEFLGDSVLSILVSSYLFESYRDIQEGELTKIRAAVVCEKALSRFAAKIELGQYMHMGHGESMNNGRSRPSILADAFEALLAAMYMDAGENFEPARKFLMPFIREELQVIRNNSVFVDYKTTLQQIVQQVEGERLEYILVGETGPDHAKVFTVEARLNSNVIGKGSAHSKREAEQNAAREALTLFGRKS